MTTFVSPNKITPIACAPWCKYGHGHPRAVSRDDQDCWGEDRPVISRRGQCGAAQELGDWDIYLPHITPCAYRGFNQLPVVYLHVELPGYDKGGFDISAKLTADEARQLAAQLVAVADEIGGAYSMEVNCQP